MFTKEYRKVLVVDRPLKPKQKLVELLEQYDAKGYSIMVFPPTETEKITKFMFFDFRLKQIFEELFNIDLSSIKEDDYFYSFDLEGVEEQELLDLLDQAFEVNIFKLTEVEK